MASARLSGNQFPSRIQLIFIMKKSQDVCLLNSISHLILDQSAEQFHLELKVFVTQEKQSDTTIRELLNEYTQVETVDFGTSNSSYAIHGLESFLVMAAIAGLSSIVFLAFLICFSHIFIPNQKVKASKASEEKSPSWVADLIIFSSFVIAITCSSLVALVVRWRKLKKETRQFPKNVSNPGNQVPLKQEELLRSMRYILQEGLTSKVHVLQFVSLLPQTFSFHSFKRKRLGFVLTYMM